MTKEQLFAMLTSQLPQYLEGMTSADQLQNFGSLDGAFLTPNNRVLWTEPDPTNPNRLRFLSQHKINEGDLITNYLNLK